MMDFEVKVMKPEERLYPYNQGHQLDSQTGCIGHLRGDMGSDGKRLRTTWEDHLSHLNTEGFSEEFDRFINAMRSDERLGCFLRDFQSLEQFCYNHPESKFDRDSQDYGFRVDTGFYSYLVRLTPRQNDYNCYIYCYRKDWLDYHISQAARGIRFITQDYVDLFRLQDGDQIRIDHQDGSSSIYTCRYIDEAHVQVGSNLFHICEFAERTEGNGSTVTPLRSSLPEQCYSTLLDTGMVVILKRGETGYYKTDIPFTDKEEAQALVDEYNKKLGVTKAQVEAMKAGSMFGWTCPAADPKNYNEDGQPIKPKRHDRGDAR